MDRRRYLAPGPSRMPPWLAVLSGTLGAVMGTATNLYSAEFREALEASGRELRSAVLPVLVAALAAAAFTAGSYWWIARRRQQTPIAERQLEIKPTALDLVKSDHDVVVGRSLQYLELARGSDELVVLLHGLGLDASDFRHVMVESKLHCIALTLYGFNTNEQSDEHYQPISLASHVQLLAYALTELRATHPRKRFILVGFSFGADMIFLLTKFAAATMAGLRVERVVLLDPNVDSTTTTISSKIAKVDAGQPTAPQLVRLLDSASSISELRYLCHYLYKITSKNFAQTSRHAREVVGLWHDDSPDQFLQYLGRLQQTTKDVRVVLSFNHQAVFNRVVHAARRRGMDVSRLETSKASHFELIEPNYLQPYLEGGPCPATRQSPRPSARSRR